MVVGQERGLGTERAVTVLDVLPTVCVYPLSMLAGLSCLVLETGVQSDDPPFRGHTPE